MKKAWCRWAEARTRILVKLIDLQQPARLFPESHAFNRICSKLFYLFVFHILLNIRQVSGPHLPSINLPYNPLTKTGLYNLIMSPIAAIAPGAKADYKAESTLARLLGSGMQWSDLCLPCNFWHNLGSAGIAELAVFHPVRIRSYSDKSTLTYERSTQLQSD